ncbi:HRDC domain-containing protein [Lewinella sp. JB7]|uniref:ribonuclease D n=1 Tax=Lewinella sp. JB7 TaxID=2962887 RepID=UPI0020C98CC6|nr:HRDC domain-containing protein [Lewinella sp. JB7]MCP9235347.1 HRDC domain-containing protein [Lewinella sp. JB7]
MTVAGIDYTLIQTPEALRDFYEEHRGIDWMGFDTEFIGEKRYHTLLCLIQVSSEYGYYLIDPIVLDDLGPFLKLIQDPGIVKITHAGDNDYRLLYRAYGITPANVFDTQIAASFIGHRYPTSFAKLVEAEVGDKLGKGYAVTDWSRRPMSEKQVKYALLDVVYLRQLYDTITGKLEANGRLEWALEECALMAESDYYFRDPNHELLNSNLARSSRTRDRLFLLRLYEWRRALAESKNYSKEMILPSKIISQLVRGVRGGKDSMLENRRLPAKTIKRYGDLFVDMYNEAGTDDELAIVNQIQRTSQEDEEDDMIIELLYLLMKYRAGEADISHALVMPRNAIRRMKQDESVRKAILGSGWRRELLGEDFVNWLKNFDRLKISIEGGKINLHV